MGFLMTSSFIYIIVLCLYSYPAPQLSTPSPPPSLSLVSPSGLFSVFKKKFSILSYVSGCLACVSLSVFHTEASSIGSRSFLELEQQMIIQLPCECQELNPGQSSGSIFPALI